VPSGTNNARVALNISFGRQRVLVRRPEGICLSFRIVRSPRWRSQKSKLEDETRRKAGRDG
jgi:hypothetical protein